MHCAAPNTESPSGAGHTPVLLQEVLALIDPRPGAWLIDATFGAGGHARALLDSAPEVHLLAIDRDPEAVARAEPLREEYGERFRFVRGEFGEVLRRLREPVDGVLFDLGVSSFHFDDPARGFSFRLPGEVDMRMDPEAGESAARFLEEAPAAELVRAVRDLGEEPRWRAVVAALLRARGSGLLGRTTTLAALVAEAARVPGPPPRLHPATRTFQGLRMAVNRELENLERGLPAAFSLLREGGVLAVISFHSLEDRMVKRLFRRWAGLPEHGADSRSQMDRQVQARILTRRPLEADPSERARNPRSRSAKLRGLQKETQP